MDNCYGGNKDRIPRELLHSLKDDRLTNKHIQTLSFLQDIINENEQLRQRKEELEKEQEKCQEFHALAVDSAQRIKDIEENCLKHADEVNQLLSDQHHIEMMQVQEEKMEMERSLKEEILKLRHELESLRRTTTVLQEDSEWIREKPVLQNRINELELLAEGLQIDISDKKYQRDSLQTALNKVKVQNFELHQLEELRTMNQTLTEELAETSQKNHEYARKIERLERELRDESFVEGDQVRLTETLKSKTAKLTREKGLAEMKEEDMRSQCQDLASLNSSIESKVATLQEECARLVREVEKLQRECRRLDRCLQHEDKDKEFWAVKRELDALREENNTLKLKANAALILKSASSSSQLCSLPLLRDDQGQGSRPGSKPKKGRKKQLLSVDSSFRDGAPSPQD